MALSESKFSPLEDGWFHLVPIGQFPVNNGGKRLVQVVDPAAVRSMVNRFQVEAARPGFAGLLIDYDHFSADPDKSSEAAGWLNNVQERPDGLWGQIRWSARGENALKGGDFRFISPVFDLADTQDLGAGRVRPLRLDGAGLTNQPNMKTLSPLTNRATGAPPSRADARLLLNRRVEEKRKANGWSFERAWNTLQREESHLFKAAFSVLLLTLLILGDCWLAQSKATEIVCKPTQTGGASVARHAAGTIYDVTTGREKEREKGDNAGEGPQILLCHAPPQPA